MNTITTICGGDKQLRTFQLSDGSIINCMIYDTAGQERFDALNFTYYKKADAILLVYDISHRGSFDKIKRVYVQAIKDNCSKDIPILLLGNKTDKEEERVISYEEGMALAIQENYEFQESSCLKNINVAGAFEILIERWNFDNHKKQKQNKIQRKNSDPNLKKCLTVYEGRNLKRLNTERNRSISHYDRDEDKKRGKSIMLTKEKAKSQPKKKKCC